MHPAYETLIAHTRRTTALRQASAVLDWDQETMMPPKGAAQRAEQAAALSAALHARRTDPRIADLMADLNGTDLPQAAQRNLALIQRDYDQATKTPEDLATAMAHATATGYAAWKAARASGRMADFLPALSHIVNLRRAYADCIVTPGQSRYDALLGLYEPGASAQTLVPMLEDLRAPLTALRGALADRPAPNRLEGEFPVEAQLTLSRAVAHALGYDGEAGRIDLTVHPFCAGTGGDVRITTRVRPDDPLDCLYAVIHETGHALYEQNVPANSILEPAGQHASMGVHESQSRLFENQIGRSRAFAEWLYPQMIEAFGPDCVASPEALYAAVNHVETGFNRTESDEVHYNLHVLLRTTLEHDLIEDKLQVNDLEAAWNDTFARDLGRQVPNPLQGVLQDVHWAHGSFGYFPTYSLGNLYAAAIHDTLRTVLPNLEGLIAQGDFAPITAWLTENVHAKANALDPEPLMAAATGKPMSTQPLLSYLTQKYSALYGL